MFVLEIKEMFNLDITPSQQGKIAIVTGANIRLGYETTIGLVKKGAKVMMACRNLEKATQAKKNILKIVAIADIEIMQLDLNALDSVKLFVETFKENHNSLDVLVNNAGIMAPPFQKTLNG